jgi:hypothetical protein
MRILKTFMSPMTQIGVDLFLVPSIYSVYMDAFIVFNLYFYYLYYISFFTLIDLSIGEGMDSCIVSAGVFGAAVDRTGWLGSFGFPSFIPWRTTAVAVTTVSQIVVLVFIVDRSLVISL